jgi:predicted phage baseplate assembly protein
VPLALKEPTFDRSFEEIYRELRSRIPRYNAAWTNYNDSDPGITLLQLFAWLAEMTLHKMGEVPRKNYLKFAELLGLQLSPARPATVRLTFTAKAAEAPGTIKAGSRYSATVEGSPPAVFQTLQALDVIGAPLDAMLVFADGSITQITPPGGPVAQPFYPLGRNPELDNALYLGFKPNPANPKPFPSKMRFLALRPPVDTNGAPQRAGRQNRDLVPPVDLVWEYRPKQTQPDWERLDVFADESAAFTRDGYVDIEGPQSLEPGVDPAVSALVKDPRYWLRVRLDRNSYPAGRPPRLEAFLPNSVDAINLQTEEETVLGVSNGRGGQYFDFPSRPVEPETLKLEVRFESTAREWKRVDDFFASKTEQEEKRKREMKEGEKEEERTRDHYVLDSTAGRVTFGDGEEGDIPPAGALIVARVWRHGGGAAANKVGPGAVKTMVDQVTGIEKVTNVRGASGGADEEDLDQFIRQVPSRLRSNDRAVTARDFESRAESIDGVRKARALGGRHPDYPGVEVPGAVTVLIVPDSDQKPPQPSAELIRSVCRALDVVRLITTEVHVAAPNFLEVRIVARVFAEPQAAFDQVAQDARERLDMFLSPLNRQFGENVSPAALYSQLFGASGSTQVRSVEDLVVYVDGRQHEEGRPIEVPPDALVYPGDHLIVVRPDQDDETTR